jgi:hypothetical protein
MIVFLVPAGRSRYELYSEAPDEVLEAPLDSEGFFRRWAHKASLTWRELVDAARRGGAIGGFARWRDAIVSRLAESIAEQRTLWSLRLQTSATMRYPSRLDLSAARSVLDRILARSRQHHGRWLVLDSILFAVSGILFVLPGPNLVAYYFAFRLIGHLQSWRGARQAIDRIAWTFEPDQGLDELVTLVDLPRAARASRVAAIAERLNLPRLSAFFDRVAVPSS